MSPSFAELLREKSETGETTSLFLLNIASGLLQKLSRLPERIGAADLSNQIREHALPVLESVREVAFEGWGSIHVSHHSPNLIVFGLEKDYLEHSYRVLFHINKKGGDTLNLVGRGWETYHLKNWFYTNPEGWRNEVEELLIKNYKIYTPPMENRQPVSAHT